MIIILKATAKQAAVILIPQQHKCATVVCNLSGIPKMRHMNENRSHLILGSVCLFLFSFCITHSKNCNDLRNGKFYYFSKKSRERIDVYRFDSLQLETGSNKGDIPQKNKIVWKGDCEYDMYINAFSDTPLTGDDSIIAATPAHAKIIYIDSLFYVCTAKLNVFDKNLQLRDTLYFAK